MPTIPLRFTRSWLACLLVIAMLMPATAFGAPPEQSTDAPPIRLQAATFTPTSGAQLVLPRGLSIAQYNANQRGYYIVQFTGPVEQAWKDAVIKEGGELLGYIPDFAYKVRMNPAEARQVADLASVGWVGIFQPAFKLSADMNPQGPGLYRIRIEEGANYGLTRAALAATGATVVRGGDNLLVVGAEADQIAAIASILDVAWIENYVEPELHNEEGSSEGKSLFTQIVSLR